MTYKIDYKNLLNEKQYEAVMHHEGPCLVIAGAGTGKTRTLVYRVARLLEDGVRPESILCLTFTNKAAENMTIKCSDMLDQRCQFINASTFHGFAYSVLKHYVAYTGYGKDFTIIDQEDAGKILDLIKEELQIPASVHKFPANNKILSILSKSVTKRMSIAEVIRRNYQYYEIHTAWIERLAETFQKFKKEQNKMDYDDLLRNFFELIKENEFIRRTIQDKYKFIMIDEYQDTDAIQAAIAKLLADRHRNIMVVGDDAQSIYAFRGADFRNIMSFPQTFEDTKSIMMEQNYRSTKEILNLGNAVMTNANERYEKNLFSDRSGKKPILIRVPDNHHESLFVADTIEHLKNRGYHLKDIAVLFRNGRFSYDLETKLNKRGLPFKKYGGKEFGQKAHIKDVMAFLKIGMNDKDVLSWHRVLKLFKGIGDKKAQKIIDQIMKETNGIEYLRAIEQTDLYHLVIFLCIDRQGPGEKIERIVKFYQPIFDAANQYGKKKWADIEVLKNMASNHLSCSDFINSVAMNSNNGNDDEKGSEIRDKEFITLSTIHSAKGLEWDVVLILSVNDGCIPNFPKYKSQEDVDEEVRLLHVAITRAKTHLYLTASRNQHHDGATGKISRFLTDEIVADCLDVEEF